MRVYRHDGGLCVKIGAAHEDGAEREGEEGAGGLRVGHMVMSRTKRMLLPCRPRRRRGVRPFVRRRSGPSEAYTCVLAWWCISARANSMLLPCRPRRRSGVRPRRGRRTRRRRRGGGRAERGATGRGAMGRAATGRRRGERAAASGRHRARRLRRGQGGGGGGGALRCERVGGGG